MKQTIQQKIASLVETIRMDAPANAVAFTLFINAEGHQADFQFREASTLKAYGVSMRALNGQFISEQG